MKIEIGKETLITFSAYGRGSERGEGERKFLQNAERVWETSVIVRE